MSRGCAGTGGGAGSPGRLGGTGERLGNKGSAPSRRGHPPRPLRELQRGGGGPTPSPGSPQKKPLKRLWGDGHRPLAHGRAFRFFEQFRPKYCCWSRTLQRGTKPRRPNRAHSFAVRNSGNLQRGGSRAGPPGALRICRTRGRGRQRPTSCLSAGGMRRCMATLSPPICRSTVVGQKEIQLREGDVLP